MEPATAAPATATQLIDPRTASSAGVALITPAAHTKLGRMSVAPARHSKLHRDTPEFEPASTSHNKFVVLYKAWRPFITPVLAAVSAVLLTLGMTLGSAVSGLVQVPAGGFSDSATMDAVSLGISGWCTQGSGSSCQAYSDGDFVNSDATLILPGYALLDVVDGVLAAAVAFSWLATGCFAIIAMLHFYLFFALSVPLDHLVQRAVQFGPDDLIAREVNIRARCSAPPYAQYEWVWWAWWAHRRSPLAPIITIVSGMTSLILLVLCIALVEKIKSATGAAVTAGAGIYMPLVALVLTIDPVANSVLYMARLPSSWRIFNNPPEPVATPLLHGKQMEHVRPAGGDSFYAARATKLPGTEAADSLDDETRRWLEAYPHDPELVPLLADLRKGGDNDHFILSDVGLLYLKPQGNETALLIPPNGSVRDELVEDYHYDSDGHHLGTDDMVQNLLAMFWWTTIDSDAHAFVDGCRVCRRADVATVVQTAANDAQTRHEPKTGWTEVPYTGVTELVEAYRDDDQPGQSAMAADMAYAIRKADEHV
ncbi:hypothetical protein Q5752_001614 [Cryptotrichosporon argae]